MNTSDQPATLLSVKQVSKKFAKDIRYNLYYGIKDILFGYSHNYEQLRHQEFWALKDISFDLRDGEILGIVGANGSGKTSLMRMIAGIYTLEQGEILTKANSKTTAIFALKSGMQPLYTGRENIYIKGALYGMSKQEIDRRLPFIEAFCELGEKLDTPFGNYSSGMGARLAYAIAVATDPNIFIIDEALAVGDSVFKTKCFEHLKEFVKQPSTGVLFVSNNIRKILKIATRVIVMEEGRVILDSQDVKSALTFYVDNCLKHLDKEKRQAKLKTVKHYDL
ncbi:MAG: ABC transporter ATP-binding protein [Lewinella sp.]|jgi:lipopolysaccharide transport system ATP-binding protein|uniref:ABC transporter ATP-binding protein n=1 Tax=Lewinella sp. TaxID=2004506 RepID=UPI003D6B0B63